MAYRSGASGGAGFGLPAIVAASFLAVALPVPGQARAAAPPAATSSVIADRGTLAAGTIFSLIPGYGLGHFLVGDYEGGMRFLAMDLGATALWMVGPSVVAIVEGAGMNATPSAASNAVFALGLLAQGGLKYWEVSSARSFVLEPPSQGPGGAGGHADQN